VAYGPVLAALVLLWYRVWRNGLDLSVEHAHSSSIPD
jgi:hypothetical protein